MVRDAWDPETTKMLRELFAQEAEEHLDAIVAGIVLIPQQPEAVRETLRRAHTLKGSAGTVGYFCLQKAAHQLEELLVDVDQGRRAFDDRACQELIRASDLLRPMVATDKLSEAEALLAQFATSLEQIRSGVAEQAMAASRPRIDPADSQPGSIALGEAPASHRERAADDLKVIRVDVERLDELMHAVEQLVIERTRMERRVKQLDGLQRDLEASRNALRTAIARLPSALGGPAERLTEVSAELATIGGSLAQAGRELTDDSEALRRTTDLLKGQLTRTKTMPIRWLYARLRRHLREIAAIEGKHVELELIGEETEIDRSVLQRISDPLIHLLRNALAHGIEPPAKRLAVGKPETGRVRVSAKQRGDMVVIAIDDDGAGIDPEGLRRSLASWSGSVHNALELGQLSDDELLNCIFLSGFSTREQADSVAGRGLGLDVVRRNVSTLGGDVSVTSTPGRGTRFLMRLPLSTAITKALLFREQSVFVVPIAHVVETLVIGEGDVLLADPKRPQLRRPAGGSIPLIWMHELLGVEAPRLTRQSAIVLSFGDREFALACQLIIGPREVVLRKLGRLLGSLGPFSAAAVGGAGGVQFAVDVAAIAQLVDPRTRRQLAFPPPRGKAVRRIAARAGSSSGRILVADDSRTIRDGVSLTLSAAGYLVDAVEDGWAAWERLKDGAYDLLVTDLEMPRLHGLELLRMCRAERLPLAIVVLTSRTSEEHRRKVLRAGADSFLVKPLERQRLLDTLARLLDTDT